MSEHKIRQCEVCGKDYVPRGRHPGEAPQRTCSRECGAKIRKPAKPKPGKIFYQRTCDVCDDDFLTKRKNVVSCSRKCLSIKAKLKARVYIEPTDKICPECGITFTVAVGDPGSSRIYCTDRCKNRCCGRNSRHNRRVRIKEQTVLMTGEPTITLLRLANRDGWVCWLCGKVVTKNDWSIDHVIQLSDGGAHAWSNIHLAHHLCNSRRALDYPETLYY